MAAPIISEWSRRVLTPKQLQFTGQRLNDSDFVRPVDRWDRRSPGQLWGRIAEWTS